MSHRAGDQSLRTHLDNQSGGSSLRQSIVAAQDRTQAIVRKSTDMMPVNAGHILGGHHRIDDSFLGGLHGGRAETFADQCRRAAFRRIDAESGVQLSRSLRRVPVKACPGRSCVVDLAYPPDGSI